jgi:hypothetical protein
MKSGQPEIADRSAYLVKQGATHGIKGRFRSEPQRIARSALVKKHFPTVNPFDLCGLGHAGPFCLTHPIYEIEDESR